MAIYRNYGTRINYRHEVVPAESVAPDYYAPSPIPCRSWTSISPEWEYPSKGKKRGAINQVIDLK